MTHVLVVDGESATRLVMVSRLTEDGYEVTGVENGALALTTVREKRFDLVLVAAAGGAGLAGIELCRRLKQIRPAIETPVVLLARNASREDAARAFEAGCDAFLTKSDLPVLEPILRGMVRTKRVLDELRLRNRGLESQVQRMVAERPQVNGDGAHAPTNGTVGPAGVWRDVAAAKPDGLLIVDDEATVRMSDRGAQELLGGLLDGRTLSAIAPTSGLEAFVRDVHSEQREGLRFDMPAKNGRPARSLLASVAPIIPASGERDDGLRVVILLDAAKRKLATELISLQEYTLPRAEVGVLRQAARFAYGALNLVGPGAAMSRVREFVRTSGASSAPVLIEGATGSGRQHVARALHFGAEHNGPFLPIACSSLTAEHVEAELFGQLKGAFADALVDRPGALQQAGRGTVYVADVDALPLRLQAKLARAIRDRLVTRAGSERDEPVEARVIASTTVDLDQLARSGAFDPELAGLLSERVALPNLAERPEDLRALTEHFLKLFGSDRPQLELSAEALAAVEGYAWTGNVLELRSCIEHACRVCAGERIELEHLPVAVRESALPLPEREIVPAASPLRIVSGVAPDSEPAYAPRGGGRGRGPGEVGVDDPIDLEHYEMKCLERALAATGGDKLAAARMLNVGKSTLYRKLKRYNLQ